MTTRTTSARHRAEVVTRTNSLAVIAEAVGDRAGGVGRQAAILAAATGLLLTSGIAANAAETNVQRESTSASALKVKSSAPSTNSAATIKISYEKPAVTTSPASVLEVRQAGGAQPGIRDGAGTLEPARIRGGAGAAITAAAYAQIGVTQDCTALATHALAAGGIHYHGWPAGQGSPAYRCESRSIVISRPSSGLSP